MTALNFLARLSDPTPQGCREWTGGSKDRNGYGRVRWNGRTRLTHRVSWEIVHGGTPPGGLRHTCDNPPCCNPEHLIPGTQAQNMADCKARGRGRGKSRWGETNNLAKLTGANVAEIRALYPRLTFKAIGAKFGVTRQNVALIVKRKTWNQ